MVHAFLLMLWLDDELVSNNMYFFDVKRCNYFAKELENQYGNSKKYDQHNTVIYCLPKLVNSKEVTIYP